MADEQTAPQSDQPQQSNEALTYEDPSKAPDQPRTSDPGDEAVEDVAPEPGSVPQQEQKYKTAQPVRVDNRTRRSDEDALEGHFVEVVDGEHSGRRGVFEQVLKYDENDGYPTEILFRSRDDKNQLIVLPYSAVRPTDYRGGR